MQWKRTEDSVPSSLIPEGLRVGAGHVQDILPLERCRAFVVPHLKSHHGKIVQTGKLAIDEASQDDGPEGPGQEQVEQGEWVRTLMESIQVLTFSSFFEGMASMRTHVS